MSTSGDTLSCTTLEFREPGSSIVRASLRLDGNSLVLRGMRGLHIRIEADDADISINGRQVHASAEQLARLQGRDLELHGANTLKEDANGVGHTYTGTEAHYWVPLVGGTANRPAPPEHPLRGADDLVTDQQGGPA